MLGLLGSFFSFREVFFAPRGPTVRRWSKKCMFSVESLGLGFLLVLAITPAGNLMGFTTASTRKEKSQPAVHL